MTSKDMEMIAKDTAEIKAEQSQAIIRTVPKQKAKLILCNAYVACVVKSLTNLTLAEGSFFINYTFVCYIQPNESLTPRMLAHMATHMRLRLDDQAGELLTDPILGEWNYEGKQFLKFTVRSCNQVLIPIEQQLNAVRNFPFDKFELQLRFELESVWIPETDSDYKGPYEAATRVRFNVWHPKNLKNGFHRGTRSREAVDRLPEYQIDFAGRQCWGAPKDKDQSQPVIIYSVEVARISLNMVWTTFFPMFATQALLVLLHTVESNISVGDMATIMLALFAFLTSARDKIPVFPQASVLDKMVFVFVIQLIFVCVDVLYEYFFPQHSARDRPIFLLISTAGFALQIVYVAYRWFRSGLTNGNATQIENGPDTRNDAFKPEDWKLAEERPKKLP